ncbi:MAG: hypothetical protein K2L49_01965, partial [Muribaculaceae bacterium]|nr:hypothetical protein [Muribaculaceae bacterium]
CPETCILDTSLADIKAVLTPEQYVQFLENNFVNNRQGNKAGNHNGKKTDNPAKKSPKRK